MYLVINKRVTAVKVSNFTGHYLRNRSTLDIGVLGYISILQHKEHRPEFWHIPPGTPCIYIYIYIHRKSGTFLLVHTEYIYNIYIQGVPGGMCQTSELFLMLKYTDITQNTYIQS